MPPKRKVTSKSKPPKVQLDPEAEKEIQKEIDFCICHFEELKNATKSEDQFKKYEKVLKTLGMMAKKAFEINYFRVLYDANNQKEGID